MTTTLQPPAPARPATRRDRTWLILGAAAVAAILVLAVLIAFAVRVDRVRAHEVAGPRDGRNAAVLSTTTGAQTLVVHIGDLGDRLYRVATPRASAQYPHVSQDGGTVLLGLDGGGYPSTVEVWLSSGVRWTLRIGVGLTRAALDLSGGSVAAVEFAAGVSSTDVRLPAPSGTVPVRLGAGASQLALHLPAGVPAQVRVGAGAGSMTLDGTARSGVPAGGTYPVGAYSAARDRYDIDLATGVSTLVLDRS